MPWQSAGAMGVIIAMFNVIPALNTGVQYLGYGKAKELGMTSNEWNYRMSKRDEAYQQHAARVRAEMEKLRVQNS